MSFGQTGARQGIFRGFSSDSSRPGAPTVLRSVAVGGRQEQLWEGFWVVTGWWVGVLGCPGPALWNLEEGAAYREGVDMMLDCCLGEVGPGTPKPRPATSLGGPAHLTPWVAFLHGRGCVAPAGPLPTSLRPWGSPPRRRACWGFSSPDPVSVGEAGAASLPTGPLTSCAPRSAAP